MNSAFELSFAPLAPTPVVIAALIAATLPALWLALSGSRGWALRALALTALALTLAGPRLERERREPLAEQVLILADHSPSQRMTGRVAMVEELEAQLSETLAQLPDVEVERRRIDADDAALHGAIADAYARLDPERAGAVIVLSDGQAADALEAIDPPDAPVHLLLTGPTDAADRALEILSAPSYGVVGERQAIELIVRQSGADDGASADVVVRRDGRPFARLRAPIGEPLRWSFEVERAGRTVFDFEAQPLDGEVSLANNRAAASVNGVRDRLRVLLVSGQPHPGLRVWRNLLKSDPAVDLVHFTILRPPEKQDGTPIHELALIAFPARELFEEKLEDFDLVIFDRYERRGLLPTSYFRNIASYVEGGGALLATSGPEFADALSLYRTPLEAVLPAGPTGEIIEETIVPQPTELGRRHPVTAPFAASAQGEDGVVWGPWLRQIAVEPDGRALLSGSGERPLLLLDRVGEGRVAQLLSDQAWLWAKGYEGGGPYAALLRRLVHWLMAEPELEEERLAARSESGGLLIERRSLDDAPIEITIESPSGAIERRSVEVDESGIAQLRASAEERGIYRISDGERTALAAPSPIDVVEMRDLSASAEPLRALREATGGGVFGYTDPNALEAPLARKISPGGRASGRGWLGVERRGAYRVAGLSSTPVPPPWLGLPIAAGLLALAWWREGST